MAHIRNHEEIIWNHSLLRRGTTWMYTFPDVQITGTKALLMSHDELKGTVKYAWWLQACTLVMRHTQVCGPCTCNNSASMFIFPDLTDPESMASLHSPVCDVFLLQFLICFSIPFSSMLFHSLETQIWLRHLTLSHMIDSCLANCSSFCEEIKWAADRVGLEQRKLHRESGHGQSNVQNCCPGKNLTMQCCQW